MVQAQVLNTVNSHGRKGFVDLVDVHFVLLDVELLQQLGDGSGRSNAHNARRHTRNRGSDELGQNGLAQLNRLAAAHEQHRRSTVRDLARVATGALVPKLRERRSDLGQTVYGRPVPDTIVLGHSHGLLLASLGILHARRNRDNLVIEPPLLLRGLGAPKRLRSVHILLRTADVEILADVLGRLSHRLHAVRSLLVLQHLVIKRLVEAVAAGRHHLRAYGNTNINRAELDLVRNILDGLEPRRAESVHG